MDTNPKRFNSALYWEPRVSSKLPSPRTAYVPIDYHGIVEYLTTLKGNPPVDVALVKAEATKFGFPFFLRTDVASAKHRGPRVYRVDDTRDLVGKILETVEDNELQFRVSAPHPKALMFREWLDLDVAFHAFEGTEIAREFRFFANAEQLLCKHPYWTEDTIRNPDVGDWPNRVLALHRPPPVTLNGLARYAARLMETPGVAWAVDFAQTKAGEWFVLDMATMEAAEHDASCPNALRSMESPARTRPGG